MLAAAAATAVAGTVAAMTSGPFLIGVDIGTTSVKAVVFSLEGAAVATGRASTPWVQTDEGTQIDATALRDAAFDALREAVDRTPPGIIAGVGIASIAESGVLLDPSRRPVGPVIAWHDRRDSIELEELGREIGEERFRATTGLPFRQQWSVTKSRWLARHVNEVSNAAMRLNVAEWVALSLGARPSTEPSLASRTGWFDIRSGTWWDEALGFAGIRADMLPPLDPCGTDLGGVAEAPHPRLRGAPVTIGGHDHQAAAVGFGAWRAGDVLDSCGTAEALVRTAEPGMDQASIEALAAHGVTVGRHALPGRWCLLGATEGGLMLGRILRMLGVDDLSRGLDEAARSIESPAVDVAVGGDGTAAVSGIGDEVTPAHVWRAAVERATADADVFARLMADAAGPNGRFLAVGGWTVSEALMDAKRRRWREVTVPSLTEAGARGAALFAGVAAGMWSSVEGSSFADAG